MQNIVSKFENNSKVVMVGRGYKKYFLKLSAIPCFIYYLDSRHNLFIIKFIDNRKRFDTQTKKNVLLSAALN